MVMSAVKFASNRRVTRWNKIVELIEQDLDVGAVYGLTARMKTCLKEARAIAEELEKISER